MVGASIRASESSPAGLAPAELHSHRQGTAVIPLSRNCRLSAIPLSHILSILGSEPYPEEVFAASTSPSPFVCGAPEEPSP